MSIINRIRCNTFKTFTNKLCYTTQVEVNDEKDNFKPLNLRTVKNQFTKRSKFKLPPQLPPRTNQMPVDQYWGNVWPGPRSFHPATVPFPIHQGYVEKGAPPNKFGNAELMKIPNFLHLTPPVIKKQCEALKKFCTAWPKDLDTDEKIDKHFPIEVISSDYCHSSSTIRDPMARIVTIKLKLSNLELDAHAKDKFLRLVSDRYNEPTDIVTIVTDRCPSRTQNYDYAMYLLTALYHESWRTEPWEKNKTETDMEYCNWYESSFRTNVELIFNSDAKSIPNIDDYIKATENLMNEGEKDCTLTRYNNSVRKLLNLPPNLKHEH